MHMRYKKKEETILISITYTFPPVFGIHQPNPFWREKPSNSWQLHG